MFSQPYSIYLFLTRKVSFRVRGFMDFNDLNNFKTNSYLYAKVVGNLRFSLLLFWCKFFFFVFQFFLVQGL